MSQQGEYLTQEKFDELTAELDQLKKVKRREIAENLEYAKSLGDLSENAEYHEAREAQAQLEDRIMKLEGMLQTAVIVALHHTEVVGIGSTVSVRKEHDKNTIVYKIVGSEEVDLSAGKISIHSPLGQAMLSKKKGENFTFTTPTGAVKYSIVSIA